VSAKSSKEAIKVKLVKRVLLMSCMVLWMPLLSQADDKFYGTVERMPDNRIGTWVIGGHKIVATEQTELEEDDGQIRVGTCVEVESEGKVVEEIERKAIGQCHIML
jgi:hypothetical protein